MFQTRNSYRRERIDLFLETRIEGLDPAGHTVALPSGERLRYDRLLLATGTRAAPLGLPGATLAGVVPLDTLTGLVGVRHSLKNIRHAVFLGEGLVGLTMAESLLARGIKVTQLVRGERFWPEVLDETTSGLVQAILEDHGVAVRRHTQANAIVGAGEVAIGVETAQGETLAADLVGGTAEILETRPIRHLQHKQSPLNESLEN
jgi:3-phenylpropionate/trans-cinnamate dioxygenase ferredoxin reductase subunit